VLFCKMTGSQKYSSERLASVSMWLDVPYIRLTRMPKEKKIAQDCVHEYSWSEQVYGNLQALKPPEIQLQYSSQVTSPAGTREYHNGAPCEAPMLTCHAQGLRVTSWINTSDASIFTHQQGFCKDQPAPRSVKHSSLHPIVASHLRMIYLGL